jgi:hypothetical protein
LARVEELEEENATLRQQTETENGGLTIMASNTALRLTV